MSAFLPTADIEPHWQDQNSGRLQQAAEKLSAVIPDAAKQRSGIQKSIDFPHVWIPGSP
jgi:hypothetical protein